MARVTLEDKWWIDLRRSRLIDLIGSDIAVDGLAVKLFRVAQEYWKHDKSGIPIDIFNLITHAEHLVRVGLVRVEQDRVFVRGSEEFLDWVRLQKQKASEAGKKSAEARRKKSGTAQPKRRTKPERTSNATRTPPNDEATKSNDIELSGSGSVFGSGSDSGFGFADSPSGRDRATADLKKQTSLAIGLYCKLWKSKYSGNIDVSGKAAGQIKTLVKDHGLKRASELIESFFEMNTKAFIEKRHDVFLILTNLPSISHFDQTGAQITQTELQRLDRTQANQTAFQMAAERMNNERKQ